MLPCCRHYFRAEVELVDMLENRSYLYLEYIWRINFREVSIQHLLDSYLDISASLLTLAPVQDQFLALERFQQFPSPAILNMAQCGEKS